MKKIFIKIFIMAVFVLSYIGLNSYAASLDSLDVSLDKTVVNAGEELKAHVKFGKQLGAYTFDFAYDNKILEFVSATGGEANDNGTKVRVTFNDADTPREDMDVTFKAKEDLTASNPTEINVTAEGLANADASEEYDDITVPITKQVTAEPKYQDYKIALSYTGDIVEKEEKEMKLSVSSAIGKNYKHVRILAEATTPDGGNVKLIGTDANRAEQDLIQSGWGDDAGYAIGGKDVNQTLNLRGTFSKAGTYSIKFKLVNRDDSDKTISEETVTLNVKEKAVIVPPEEEPGQPGQPEQPEPEQPEEKPDEKPDEKPEEKPGEKPEQEDNIKDNNTNSSKEEKTPTHLPKTGINLYAASAVVIMILVVSYIYVARKEK